MQDFFLNEKNRGSCFSSSQDLILIFAEAIDTMPLGV